MLVPFVVRDRGRAPTLSEFCLGKKTVKVGTASGPKAFILEMGVQELGAGARS
jgi:hypothetical protein